MSSQESIDAAIAALKNYATAQQQQQQQQQQQTSTAPALQPLTLPLPLQAAPTPAATLQQLLSAVQQQQQTQPVVARQPQPLQLEHQHQPQHSYPSLDPNMARIAATLMPNALHQAASSAAVPTSSCSTSHGIKVALGDNSTSTPTAPADAHPLQQQQQDRPPPPPPPTFSIEKMQRWTKEQLESHVKALEKGGYPVPQAVKLILAEARRKEERREAKRIANRKSANTSRARKKAQMDQLMNENQRLRKQELILSYLPDPVIVISNQGTITFCSQQVERVLRHKVEDLLGRSIQDIMAPKSRVVMKKLIRDMMVIAEQESGVDDTGVSSGGYYGLPRTNSSFPMMEVNLNSAEVDAGEDLSDSYENRCRMPGEKKSSRAAATEMSSLTRKDSSFNSSDDVVPQAKKESSSSKKTNDAGLAEKEKNAQSIDACKLSQLNKDKAKTDANLSKNVEACKLNKDKAKTEQVRFAHKDDVMGASVTANNADAKLSSLIHEPSLKTKHVMVPKPSSDKQEEQSSSTSSLDKPQAKEGNASEDSGYRESGESPEDSNSSSSCGGSADQPSKQMMRSRPIAPSRNVCLIRSDLSTIWCELTSSIRTSIVPRSQDPDIVPKDEGKEENLDSQEQLETELFLCFRPTQEGEVVSSDLRLREKTSRQENCSDDSKPKIPGVSESSRGGSGSNGNSNGANPSSGGSGSNDNSNGANPSSTETQNDVDGSMYVGKAKPLKKRALEDLEACESNKKSRPSETNFTEV